MNLFERTQNLSRDILALENLKKRADQAGIFEKRAQDLSVPAKAIQELDDAIKVISKNNIAVLSLDRGLVGSLRDQITDLKKRYEIDKNVMIEPFPGKDVRYCLFAPLKKLPSVAIPSLQEAWRNWSVIKLQLPEIQSDVLDTLGRIAALRESVATIRGLMSEANKICNKLPDSDNDFIRLEKLGKDIVVAWKNLAGDGIPKEVLAFLRAVGNPLGAEYSALTTDVFNWLSLHGLDKSLRIKMGG